MNFSAFYYIVVSKMKMIYLIKIFIIIVVCSISYNVFAGNKLDYSLSCETVFSILDTKNIYDSKSEIINSSLKLDLEYLFIEKYFGIMTFSIPILNEDYDEKFKNNGHTIFKNDIEYSKLDCKVLGGIAINNFINPFFGLTYEKHELDRSGYNNIKDYAPLNQIYKGSKIILGIKGGYDFSDYLYAGYNIKYGYSKWMTVETKDFNTDNENSDEIGMILSIKYWMPNEIICVGADLGWQKVSFKKTKENNFYTLLTDIENFGIGLNVFVLL